MKVLLSAYACRPHAGSEPSVGWNWTKEISKFNKVWVMTIPENKKHIEKECKKRPLKNAKWVYFDIPLFGFLKNSKIGIRLHYFLWQIQAYFVARKLNRNLGFGAIQHLTYVNYWMPSFLPLLPIPFIWGPVGGGESIPKKFLSSISFKHRILEYLRVAVRWINEKTFAKIAAKRAKITIAVTKETALRLEKLGCKNIKIESQLLINNDDPFLAYGKDFLVQNKKKPVNIPDEFRMVSIGRLLPWKGYHLSLAAFADFSNEFPNSKYWIVGDGPEMGNLIKMARKHKINDNVKFFGNISRQKALQKIQQSHVLVHPSLHDSGAWVCIEAMALNTPVICLNLGGPGLNVCENTGIKIEANEPEAAVLELSNAMGKLAKNPNLRDNLGNQARKHAINNFSIKKSKFIRDLYSIL
jgi:glycosyltransferase involved in cell wall biosynthesis